MKLKIRGTFLISSMVSITLMTGCASLLVRSDGGRPGFIYPATIIDSGLIWEGGIKGEPVFAIAPGDPPFSRTGFIRSSLIILGGLIDLPFSLTTDTLFLPFDLFKLADQGAETEVRQNSGPE